MQNVHVRMCTHPHPHMGVYRLRVHVGLSVPDGDVGMRVGDEARAWREGEALVFDDSFEHEVWNEAGAPRLVFILDAWHPDLRSEHPTQWAPSGTSGAARAFCASGARPLPESRRARLQTSLFCRGPHLCGLGSGAAYM